jgi:hypothetical protein
MTRAGRVSRASLNSSSSIRGGVLGEDAEVHAPVAERRTERRGLS